MRWLLAFVLCVGCTRSEGPPPTPRPNTYTGTWPSMIGPDGEYCFPIAYIEVGKNVKIPSMYFCP